MLIVQKYGGVTVGTPERIRKVARRIQADIQRGNQVVAIVSAMGKTTNDLIALANQVSPAPPLRELDMLLTAGERISMALLSMALNDLGCEAISFTGSQAGILTNDSHVNALIEDVKAFRVAEELAQKKVVVLAGFQGVSPKTKEITTLGRGGTDTTAVAMACYLKADRCEIIKDVAGVYSADPNLISEARNLPRLTYQQLADMTFGGAKVVHYRAIELAQKHQMPLLIGPMDNTEQEGTFVSGENMMKPGYENVGLLSLNSFARVLKIRSSAKSAGDLAIRLSDLFRVHQIADPQILHSTFGGGQSKLYVTGPEEILTAIEGRLKGVGDLMVEAGLCLVTATCTGSTSPALTLQILKTLDSASIPVESHWLSALSVFLIVPSVDRERALKVLHGLI